MRRTTSIAIAAVTAGALLALAAAPVAAGRQLTMTVTPNPATVGETVTVTPDQPCPDPANVLQVDILVDDLNDGDQIFNTSADPVTGQWAFQFPAGPVSSYEVTATCVYLQRNLSYVPQPLAVVAAPTTTTTTTTTTAPSTTTTATPTTTTAAPVPAAVVVTPAYTG